jgi:hypothetical protein
MRAFYTECGGVARPTPPRDYFFGLGGTLGGTPGSFGAAAGGLGTEGIFGAAVGGLGTDGAAAGGLGADGAAAGGLGADGGALGADVGTLSCCVFSGDGVILSCSVFTGDGDETFIDSVFIGDGADDGSGRDGADGADVDEGLNACDVLLLPWPADLIALDVLFVAWCAVLRCLLKSSDSSPESSSLSLPVSDFFRLSSSSSFGGGGAGLRAGAGETYFFVGGRTGSSGLSPDGACFDAGLLGA